MDEYFTLCENDIYLCDVIMKGKKVFCPDVCLYNVEIHSAYQNH